MTTPILGAPYLTSAQAIPETTVNEQVRILEQGARWFVFIDRDETAPPGSPSDGDAYLVATGGTGAWSGHDGEIAHSLNGAWEFIEPSAGMAAYVVDEDVAVVFDGADWNDLATAAGAGGALDDLTDVDASSPSDGDVLTFDNGTGDWVAAAPAGGGGGTWALAASWTYSTNVTEVDFTGLGSYQDIIVIGQGITKSASTTVAFRLSTDNGANYIASAGSYESISVAGVPTGTNGPNAHDTNASAARSFMLSLFGINVNGAPKWIVRPACATDALFVASTSPVNAIRIFLGAVGNITGGSIFVWGR